MLKSTLLFALALLADSSSACRPWKTTCGTGINRYWGSDVQTTVNNIPAGDAGHLITTDEGYQVGALRVWSKCLSCDYSAYDNEIKCMGQDIVNKCGGGDAFHPESNAENDWYIVHAGPIGV